MHEMALIENVLRIVNGEGKKANAEKILSITIRMGEYSDVVPRILREYFAIASKGSIAEGAKIILNRVPAVMKCRECGWKGSVQHGNVVCGECQSTNLQLISGREFIVESLEAQQCLQIRERGNYEGKATSVVLDHIPALLCFLALVDIVSKC